MFVALVVAGQVPPRESSVQQEFDEMLQDTRRLVIFQPDPGQLIHFIAGGRQMLFYYRNDRREKGGYCNDVSNEAWRWSLTNHGSDPAAAHSEHQESDRSLREHPDLTNRTRFEHAGKRTGFVFDTRKRVGYFLCGIHKTTTLFRIGGAVVTASEEFWNKTPIEKPHLAQRLGGLLGWR